MASEPVHRSPGRGPIAHPAEHESTPMNAVRKMALLSIATSIATLALKFGAYFLTGSVSLWSDAVEAR